MFQISRHLSVESGPKVSKAGPGSIHVLRPNSVSDFQYRPVLDVKSVGSVPRSNPASTRPESITGFPYTGKHQWEKNLREILICTDEMMSLPIS